jgi:bacterioferritin
MDKSALIGALNNDLAGELQAIIMYTVYSAQVKGPFRPELAKFMQAEIPDELTHAQFLADKIASLGGTPTAAPRAVPPASNVKDMLQNILKAEEAAIADYTARAQQAESAGEIGLKVQLENIIVDETKHREETQKILSEWK